MISEKNINLGETLPIGSIVKVNGIGRKIMIFGYMQVNRTNSEETYDYIGVVYPEGHLDSSLHIGFNHSEIENVFFTGFEDQERKDLFKVITELSNN